MSDYKRAFVANLYPGPHWKNRVAQMSDEQVYAIWIKYQEDPPKKDNNKRDDIPL